MSTRNITLGETEWATFIQMLEQQEQRLLAILKLKYGTEAENTLLLQQCSILQSAYLQLLGAHYVPANGAPDWSGLEDLKQHDHVPPPDWSNPASSIETSVGELQDGGIQS